MKTALVPISCLFLAFLRMELRVFMIARLESLESR